MVTTGERSARSSVAAFVAFAASTFAAAGLAGLITSRSVGEWYPTLDTPPWTPPSWVISTAWSILYPLIAFAGWLNLAIWRLNA
jgi:benzodiazapine receptor